MVPPLHPRSGFSLIEALVVLAIGGMALAIIFSIGIKAGDTGFGLGRRAMAAADTELSTNDLRSLLRSYSVRPAGSFVEGVDRPVEGTSTRLVGEAVMERATQCAPQGWAGELALEIEQRDGLISVVCQANGRRVTLASGPGARGGFQYSSDAGSTWSDTWRTAQGDRFAEPRSARVWIRLTGPGMQDIVETAGSGRPQTWARDDLD
ncbi:pilus assembly FimT family protein [Brevundimonas variabilis]|uniref:Prepilin-type N-terminal cleavage/methylation domain-containing protein n=1 Tax=Brevundimonas variabilis TaxID=74312 RepID=A0A7W9CGR3_9CAUL|nr:prepilin-type N-terminal cleavage/methylation domain-containing protein [Brevundimonas variabilis]MBB5745335.1 prepilin-type N-terminal cleavage/methylation domain-containing protein [Brevundimonas variabilis]